MSEPALDPDHEQRIRDSVGRQTLLTTLGIELAEIAPGRPASGERFRAIGTVVRAGTTITVCSAEVLAVAHNGSAKPVALMQATMITV